VLACLGLKPGTVHVELYDLKKTQFIPAHTNPLSHIVLNFDGTRLATASEKGTLVRIFDTDTGAQLRELRRGADKADIYSIAFNPLSTYLVVASDKGTVHIYGLEAGAQQGELQQQQKQNRGSSLAFIPFLPSYFSSEWSFAQFHVPDTRCICAFGPQPNTIVVVGANGAYYKFTFDAKGADPRPPVQAFFHSEKSS